MVEQGEILAGNGADGLPHLLLELSQTEIARAAD